MAGKHLSTEHLASGDEPGTMHNLHLLPHLRGGFFPRGDGYTPPRPEGLRARPPFVRVGRRVGRASVARVSMREAA